MTRKKTTSADLQKILNSTPSYATLGYVGEREQGRKVVVIEWGIPGHGFGELTFITGDDGLFIDTEHSSEATVMKILGQLVGSAIFDTDPIPEHHLAYNKATGRQCGEHCKICHP